MPTRSPTERETWKDWIPESLPEPQRLLTRDQLVNELKACGVDVGVNDLRFWEYEGILPRPVKRWHNGANRVFYPRWIASTIILLRALQQASTLSLHEIAPILREESSDFAHQAANWERLESGRLNKALPFTIFLGFGLRRFTEVSLGEDLQKHAEVVSHLFGKTVTSIRLELIGEDGPVEGGSYVQPAE